MIDGLLHVLYLFQILPAIHGSVCETFWFVALRARVYVSSSLRCTDADDLDHGGDSNE